MGGIFRRPSPPPPPPPPPPAPKPDPSAGTDARTKERAKKSKTIINVVFCVTKRYCIRSPP